jgi:hypothetical protein
LPTLIIPAQQPTLQPLYDRSLAAVEDTPPGGRAGVDQDSLDVLPLESLDRLQDRGWIERLDARDADEVAMRVGRALQAEQDGRWTEERRVDADDSERVRPTGDESPCRRVGSVAELAHGGQHALAGEAADVAALVDDAGDRLGGDSGQSGDIGHRGRSAPGAARVRGRLGQLR